MFSKKARLICLNEEEQQWMVKFNVIRLPELPDDIWVQIMGKLPIKPLHICKCVSKTWHSHVSHILSCHKGLEPPPYGILFRALDYSPVYDSNCPERRKLGYLSFADYKITQWLTSDKPEFEPNSAVVDLTDHQNNTHDGDGTGVLSLSLGNLTIDFSFLIPDPETQGFWTMHRGLVLVSSSSTRTFHVYNPATREKFVLPRSPSLAERDRLSKPIIPLQAAIINLSDCLLSTQCNFRVIRLLKKGGRGWAEIYSSNKNQWIQSEFSLDRAVYAAKWTMVGAVILDNTLYFTTDQRLVVVVTLLSDEQISVYSLHLPQLIQNGLGRPNLYGSQGCLYLSYGKEWDLWIWKHNGMSLDAEAWIPQLVFKYSGVSLCQPVAEKYLRQIVGTNDHAMPVVVHPEAPVVFIHMLSSIFAFHLLNDTVEKIAELSDTILVGPSNAHMYSPCFASLG